MAVFFADKNDLGIILGEFIDRSLKLFSLITVHIADMELYLSVLSNSDRLPAQQLVRPLQKTFAVLIER